MKALWAFLTYILTYFGGYRCLKFNLPLVELQTGILWPRTVFLIRGCLTCSLIFQFLSVRSRSSQAWKIILPGFKNLTRNFKFIAKNIAILHRNNKIWAIKYLRRGTSKHYSVGIFFFLFLWPNYSFTFLLQAFFPLPLSSGFWHGITFFPSLKYIKLCIKRSPAAR